MNPNEGKPLYGLVLEGGLSTRMGTDKAMLNYHGQPQREFVFALLQKFCSQVYHSVKSSTKGDSSEIADIYSFKGPLNGILSAFKYRSDVAWLTLPVDMPLVDESVIQFLMDSRDQASNATCFYDTEGKLPEPLLAIWEPQCAMLLQSFYNDGNRSTREFLLSTTTNLVKAPDKKVLKNINTRDDFNEYRMMHSKKS